MNQAILDDLEKKLNVAFRPHSPIDDPLYFFGREAERQSLRETAFRDGQHAVIYGEKGAGKTSLARVSVNGLSRIDVFCEEDSTFQQVMRDLLNALTRAFGNRIVFDYRSEVVMISGVSVPLKNITGNDVKNAFKDDDNYVIVFDEVDRLSADTIQKLGEFVKSVATDKRNITIILIGASSSEQEILRGHGSVFRNTKFIRLEKFSSKEAVEEITKKGGDVLGINFSSAVVDELTQLSDLYPFYVQLLSVSAARETLKSGRTNVEVSDVVIGAAKAAEEADTSLQKLYQRSILSAKSSIYKDIVWGLAKLDSSTELSIGQIAEAASRVSQETISPQSAGAAIKKLTDGDDSILKSNVLGPKRTFYSFRHPLMKSYVRIRIAVDN
jgi:uncharacterized protein